MPFSRANAEMEMTMPHSFGRARLRRAATSHAPPPTAGQSLALPKPSSDASLHAFTLIELLVVIVIIAVLMGLAFPVFQGVQNQAKKTQAKNDLTQIVTAVNAFYTEYGRYPTTATTDPTAIYESGGANTNDKFFIELFGKAGTINTRQVAFISPPNVKDDANPRSGVTTAGRYYDPWGTPYSIALDADYDNEVTNPYGADNGAGPLKIRQGVIAWSLGKDVKLGKDGNNKYTSSDDVISWQ